MTALEILKFLVILQGETDLVKTPNLRPLDYGAADEPNERHENDRDIDAKSL